MFKKFNFNVFCLLIFVGSFLFTELVNSGSSSRRHILEVENGQGSGEYSRGKLVSIKANAAAEGLVFSSWSGDVATIIDVSKAETKLLMPRTNIAIKANYITASIEVPSIEPPIVEPPPVVEVRYKLQINNGDGSGKYLVGERINIKADNKESEDLQFDKWSGDVGFLINNLANDTILTMPNEDVSLTAEYAEIEKEEEVIINVASIPGVIEAEDFNDDRPGVAYADFDSGNIDGAYRDDVDVDIYQENEKFIVGYIRTGEYINYTLNVTKEGIYNISGILSAPGNSGRIKVVEVRDGSEKEIGLLNVPNTGGWNNFKKTNLNKRVLLLEGQTTIKLLMDRASDFDNVYVGNLDKLIFEYSDNQDLEQLNDNRVKLIFDTDMDLDFDDCGNLGMLHAMADNDEVDILAVMHNSSNNYGVGAIDAINTYYGRPNIPIGSYKGSHKSTFTQRFYRTIALNYPSDIKQKSQAPDAVSVYRQVLSDADDNSIVISSVGFTTNLSNLLNSGPDQYSNLNGKDLIQRKVKLLVQMAGAQNDGFNITHNGVVGYSVNTFNNWPTEVVISTSGSRVFTGLGLRARGTGPVADCFKGNPWGTSRQSWDQIASLYAIRGNTGFFNESRNGFYRVTSRKNGWVQNPNRNHHVIYLKNEKRNEMRQLIDSLMEARPKN